MNATPVAGEVLRDDGLTCLVRVRHSEPARGSGLVKFRSGSPSAVKAVSLHTDHETVTRHRLACALPFEHLAGSGQDAMLHFRDPGGACLGESVALTLQEWIETALRMVDALDEIHQAGLVHRDLRPDSFLLSPQRLYVVDFSRAVRLRREYRDMHVLDGDVRRLWYVAPELTGRLNRAVDYRCDYYSLGAVLYELLTGHLPFAATDPHELIYQHLAMVPADPRRLNSELPAVLSGILLRLLEKDPERRYQHAHELLADLRLAREVVLGLHPDEGGLVRRKATPLPLDVLQRMYGRNEERGRLLDALESAFAREPRLLLIAGASGIGKTTLIRETYIPVTRERAFFVSGKFDQLRRGTPYSAWCHALESLVEFVLAEPEQALADWRLRLSESLGPLTHFLRELVPPLKALLEDDGAAVEVSPIEAKEQINEAFVRFFQVFAETDRPLVVFLDDLQWIDSASLELLETLVRRLDRVPVLMIGAYRDNEVTRTHPLMLSLRTLGQAGRFGLEELALSPLEEADVVRLLADGVGRGPSEVQELAREVMRRTGGNPFFLWQLLRTLRDNGWLFVDPDRQRWDWDLAGIRQAGFAEQVVDLMSHRFHALPGETQQLLSWAACLGIGFDLQVLSWLSGQEPEAVHDGLLPALDEEFILPAGEPELVRGRVITTAFRFLHDRMQEVALKALPTSELAALHRRIAELLLERLPEPAVEARIIDIAGHMNLARELIATAGEGMELARLNLRAARKAKASAAFEAGLKHLRLGMSRLPPDVWERDGDLAFALYRERGELEYLNSEFDEAEWFVRQAIRREHDIYRRADLYDMLIVQATLRARYSQAVETANEGLALFGETLPRDDFEAARDRELARVRELLGDRSLARMGDLPPMQDRPTQAVVMLLTSLGPPCYRAHPRLWSVIVAREIRLCLEHGAFPGAVYSYPGFGGLLTHVGEGDGQACAALHQATRTLMERFNDPANSSIGYLMMGSSLRHWFSPMGTACEDYLSAYRTGQASGNLQYAVYGFGHNTYCRYFKGDPLDELIPEALDYLDYSRQRRNLWGVDLITGALRIFELLHGEWSGRNWPNRGESEQSYLERCEAHGNLQVLCIYHIMRASALLLMGDPIGARWSVEEAESRLDSVSVQGLLPVTQFHVLKVLVSLVESEQSASGGTGRLDAQLGRALARYRCWASGAPDNFTHWCRLLEAEDARRRGDLGGVIDAYDKALEAAQRQSCWPAVALIAWRSEGFWRRRGRNAFADVYREQMQQALERQRAWAAAGRAGPATALAATGPRSPQIDAVIQIAQALSLHTELAELVPEIIRTVAHQTGAQRVVLLLVRDETLRVAMESGVGGSRYHEAPPRLEDTETLPRSVIRYVARAQRPLRFGQAEIGSVPMLGNDPYLQWLDGPDSGFSGTVCCVPLSYLGQLLGVLYLEHNLTADAFDEGQEPLVEFLAAQAAISVRNIDLINRLAAEGQARRAAEMRMQTADAEISARREQEQRLKELANTDPLTELANRRRFIDVLRRLWERIRHGADAQGAVLMLDIDHFKRINDRQGHAVGDDVLRHLAGLFRANLRPSDLAARIGGEEFAILLYDGAAGRAVDLGRRLCEAAAASPLSIDGRQVEYTVSVGVAYLDPGDPSHDSVLQRADRALYQAKADGRNRVRD